MTLTPSTLRRWLPLIVIALGAIAGAIFLRDQLSFEALRENREALLAAGLWGVPSFRVADFPAQWGQDRLWVVEQQWRSKQ